jgi:hypothetical protein
MNPTRRTVFLALLLGLGWLPGTLRADKVLIVGSGDPTNMAALQTIQQSVGDSVTIGPTFNNFTGAGLAGYNELMLLPNAQPPSPYNSISAGDMPASGQQAILNFVNSGGGLITSEMVLQKYNDQHAFQTLYPVFPMPPTVINTSNSPITFSALTTNPVLSAHLPSSFSFPTGSSSGSEMYYAAKPGATGFFATNQWTTPQAGALGPAYGLVGWNYGQGHVISFSTLMDNASLANKDFAQLVSNAVAWAGGDASAAALGPPYEPVLGPNPPSKGPVVPEPAGLAIWASGLVALAALSRAYRGKSPAA